jgi:hypothetical protein
MTLDIESTLAIVFSAISSLRALAPNDKHINLAFLKDWKFLPEDDDRRNFIEGMFSSIIATIFWILTYHSQRIDITSPEGFIFFIVSLFSGPFLTIGWSIKEWNLRKGDKLRMLSLFSWSRPERALVYKWGLVIVVLASFFGGGAGYLTGLVRPYENGVVIATFAGLDEQEQIRFKDKLQINLEHLQQATGTAPRYYGSEVADTDSADKAAFNTNQRFVVWGSVYIEERSDKLLADISIRVRDVSQRIETYSSKEYSVEGTTRSEIIKRVTNDLTVAAVWTLGLAEAGWSPTYDSTVQATQILAQLSSEDIHNNVAETKDLGLLFMDKGFKDLYGRLIKTGIGWQTIADIYDNAISLVEASGYQGLESGLARLYNYYSAALVDGFDSSESRRTATDYLSQAIELDQQYPMPHYYLAWLSLKPGGSDEDAARNCCEFLRKLEIAYGGLAEDARGCFNKEYNDVNNWLKTLGVECNE